MPYPLFVKTRGLSKITVLALLAVLFSATATNAAKPPVAGAKCAKLNQVQIYKNKSYKCIKSKKGLVWNKGTLIRPTAVPSAIPTPTNSVSPTATPSPTPTPTPTPTPSTTPTPTPTPSSTPTPTPSPTPTEVGYTVEQVRANNSSASCWTIIDGSVYNLTQWINAHPGGAGVIRSLCGVDGTASFKAQHDNQRSPAQRLSGYLLGPLRR
ncbi:MAG: hypothetical protein RLZZ486_788 [Actinomycetota bacterium]